MQEHLTGSNHFHGILWQQAWLACCGPRKPVLKKEATEPGHCSSLRARKPESRVERDGGGNGRKEQRAGKKNHNLICSALKVGCRMRSMGRQFTGQYEDLDQGWKSLHRLGVDWIRRCTERLSAQIGHVHRAVMEDID